MLAARVSPVLVALAFLAACGISDPPAPATAASTAASPPDLAAAPAPPVSNAPATPPAESARASYTVVAGDTLGAIAQRHDLDVRDIAKWNDIDDVDRIDIGRQLHLGPT